MTRLGNRTLWRAFAALLSTLAVTATLGCTTSANTSGKPLYAVKGKVMVGDRPAAGAELVFVPANEPAGSPDPRPRATVEEDGTFALSTYGDKDGAPAGEYVVLVRWPGKVLPDGREEPEDKLYGRYYDASRPLLKATVQAGPNELPTFQLK